MLAAQLVTVHPGIQLISMSFQGLCVKIKEFPRVMDYL